MKDREKNNIDLSKSIPIAVAFLLCAGILSQTVYYSFFNIPITKFLSLSEVLLLFTQDIIRFIIIFSILFVVAFLFHSQTPKFHNHRAFIDYCNTDIIEKRFIKYLIFKKLFLLFLAFGIVIFSILLYHEEKIIYLFILYFSIEFGHFFIRFLLTEYKRTLRLNKGLKKENRKKEIIFLYGLSFIVFIIVWSIIDVQKVKYEKKFINVSFVLNDTLIKSDSTKYYIGHTEKYLFYYDSNINETSVFNKENVSELKFGEIYYMRKPAEKKGE